MDMRFAPKPLEPILTIARTKDDELIHGILEALSYADIHGEEATIGLIEVLKRIHRPDLLTPCERSGD